MSLSTRNRLETTSKRCAIYTRKSSEEGLEQTFNSLDAQREACESYIQSQRHEGWSVIQTKYDDGGFSGGNMARPALTALLNDIKNKSIDVIVVYKVDRLSRSLADFVRLIELFDQHNISFVSVTQQFNTSTSMGRLTLNVLLSFAQFEREVTSERIRDKFAASKQKGMWMGGGVPMGYDVQDKLLVVNETEAKTVRHIFNRYLELGCVRKLKSELDAQGYLSKSRERNGISTGNNPLSRGILYGMLKNPVYIGKTRHKAEIYDGQHAAIVDAAIWYKVQDLLTRNKHLNDVRTLSKDPSLLAGLIFDDKNNPMSPTHARKHNRRYRYYISQASLQYKEKETGSVVRIAAHIVESLIITTLLKLLTTTKSLLEVIQQPAHSPSDIQIIVMNANRLASAWNTKSPSEHIALLRTMICRITLAKDEVKLIVSRAGIRHAINPDYNFKRIERPELADDEYEIVKSVQLKRSGIESKLIITDEPIVANAHPDTIKAIQNAVTKALIWNDALITGSVKSMTELAKQEGVVPQFIIRRIKLAYLAPDIIDAILNGDIPDTLSIGKLEKSIPLNWLDQRQQFGFGNSNR